MEKEREEETDGVGMGGDVERKQKGGEERRRDEWIEELMADKW